MGSNLLDSVVLVEKEFVKVRTFTLFGESVFSRAHSSSAIGG